MAPQPTQTFVLSDVELGNWCSTALRSVFQRGVLEALRKTIVRDHIDGHVFAWMLRTGRMTTLNVKGVEGTLRGPATHPAGRWSGSRRAADGCPACLDEWH